MLTVIKTSLRSIFAALVAFVGTTGAFLVNDTRLGDITDGQWFYVAGITLTAFGGVWGFVNLKPTPEEIPNA
jgi:hypothetical protein